MSFIRADVQPDTIGVGRTARNVSYKADTRADWVAEVDEVLEGEQVVDEATAARTIAENAAHNAALPPPPPPPPAPIAIVTPADAAALSLSGPLEAARVILAKADADITAGETKTLVLLMARYFFHKWVTGWR